MNKNSTILIAILALFFPLISRSQQPIIKVDLNIDGRRAAEVNEIGYHPWPIQSGKSIEKTIDGIRFSFSAKDSQLNLNGDYYKKSVQVPYYARLAGDGLMISNANGKAKIEMRISGLPEGIHTLLTYHNKIDGKSTVANPIDISVDGLKQIEKLTPSHRVLNNTSSESAYLKINAKKGKDIIILFETSDNQENSNLIINGFELNTSDVKKIAMNPIPANADEHADADNHQLLLHWKAAAGSLSHDIYIGEDSTAVADAKRTSSLFKGNQKTTEFRLDKITRNGKIFWRVDQVYKDETIKGNSWYFRPRQLAFPDAEGYGRFARGGRGGKVVAVTNLNDDGPGSLRAALTENIGPRTVVFNVSGIIRLKSRLVSNQRYVTIAGQTAPGKGICIAGAPLGVVGDDNIARFMRVRLGAGTTFDGMGLTGADHSIIDHCSISWTIDEAFSSRGSRNITLQRTMIAEALNQADHNKKAAGNRHGFAATISGNRGSFHHNLLAHNEGRNWSLGGGLDGDGYYAGEMDITNNVVYNWGGRTTDGGTKAVNFVNNYYKPGPATRIFVAFNAQREGVGLGKQQAYMAGNVMPGYFDENNQEKGRKITWSNGDTSKYETFVSKPFFPSYVTTQTAEEAYKNVLSDVGANSGVFDDHDIRIIKETLNGTFTYRGSKTNFPGLPDSHLDVGGWEDYPVTERERDFDTDNDGLPDWWEKLKGTNPNSKTGDFSDSNADKDGDGFSELEDYLNWLAAPHYTIKKGTELTVDLKSLSAGYTKGCSYSVVEAKNGSAKIDSKGVLEFTPEKSGLASFVFQVKDKDGSTMARKVNIRIVD